MVSLPFFLIPFRVYGSPPIVGLLESFLTFAGYLCPYHSGVFRGGVGHLRYPGAEVYFEDCLDEWFRELMVGRLDCVASGGLLRGCSSCLGLISMGRGSTLICIPLVSGSLRMRVRLCFGGHCLVCPVIGLLMWMWRGLCLFSLRWLSGIHLRC